MGWLRWDFPELSEILFQGGLCFIGQREKLESVTGRDGPTDDRLDDDDRLGLCVSRDDEAVGVGRVKRLFALDPASLLGHLYQEGVAFSAPRLMGGEGEDRPSRWVASRVSSSFDESSAHGLRKPAPGSVLTVEVL